MRISGSGFRVLSKKPFDSSFSLCYPMFIDKCYEEKSSQSEDGQASPESESGHG